MLVQHFHEHGVAKSVSSKALPVMFQGVAEQKMPANLAAMEGLATLVMGGEITKLKSPKRDLAKMIRALANPRCEELTNRGRGCLRSSQQYKTQHETKPARIDCRQYCKKVMEDAILQVPYKEFDLIDTTLRTDIRDAYYPVLVTSIDTSTSPYITMHVLLKNPAIHKIRKARFLTFFADTDDPMVGHVRVQSEDGDMVTLHYFTNIEDYDRSFNY